ncbi:MAG: MBL fold metallo-hydrolase [Desulfomonile tiedjei]|nr:MBL fold metallo-hydrolase [Desulfomonile tiedjei]
MEMTILGSGTATPLLDRNASGLAVTARNRLILVDIGPGILRRMCEAGIDSKLVDLILITHFHPDHVSDLVPFLFAANYAFGPVRTDPFSVVGPEGLEQFYEGLVRVYDGWIQPTGGRLQLRELTDAAPVFGDIEGIVIRSVCSAHSAPCRAYRIESNGVSVTITGDTDVSDEIVDLARGTDVFVCECSLPDGMKVPGHLTPSEAGTMAQRAGVGKLVLTHFYPPCEDEDVVGQAAKVFSGHIVKARDLMKIAV